MQNKQASDRPHFAAFFIHKVKQTPVKIGKMGCNKLTSLFPCVCNARYNSPTYLL
jgi:hypothetical protein